MCRFAVLFLGPCVMFSGCREPTLADRPASSEASSESSSTASGFSSSSTTASSSSSRSESPSQKFTGTDWPCFLGPDHNSTSTEKGIIAPWPDSGLRVVWYQKAGQGYAAPSISGKRLFLFDREDKEARLRALDRKTGDTFWTFKYPTNYEDDFGYSNGPRCCPVVDGDRVYLHGVEGMLYCLAADTGKEIWKIDAFQEFKVKPNFFGVGSTPLVEDDLLIVQIGGASADDDDQPNGTAVVAFDKLTGKVKYKLGDEFASYSSPVAASIGDRRWCFVLARGGLIAFDPKTGKQDFHFPWRAEKLASVNASNPVIIDDRVFISEAYGPGSALLKVKPGNYELLWSDKRKRDAGMKAHWVTPIYCNGYLYGDSGYRTYEADLRCIEFATGKVKWQAEDFGHSSLLMVDGHLVCLTERGELRLLKVNSEKYDEVSRMVVREPGKDGKVNPKGRRLVEHPCWAAPVLAHGLLYVRGRDYVVCLELIAEESK